MPRTWPLLISLLTPLHSHAQNHLQLESGFSFSDSTPLIQNTPQPNQQRLGLQIALASHWQKLTPQGGFNASLYAYQDWALQSEQAHIQQLNLQGQKLHALNEQWLSRTQLNANHYQNQQQPTSSYQSLGFNQTLGYFASNNAGWDFGLGLQQRNYNHTPSGNYQGQQWEASSVYYFTSRPHHARWAAALTLQQFNASDIFYNSISQQLDLSYGQWQWQQLRGTLALQWQNNRYPNTRNQLSETYTLLRLNSHYPLAKHWQFITTLSGGRYHPSSSAARLLFNAYLGIKTEL